MASNAPLALLERVPCKYADIGCEEQPLRKDLKHHENDYRLHLQHAVETIRQQQREMKAMKEEQRELEEDQRATEADMRAIAAELGEMQEELKEERLNIAHTQASPRVFRMPEFNQHKTLNQDWYSPPFYIHHGSYKMCICVEANGYAEGKGTHISVFVYLMRGKNDDNLPWPFRGEVTITLLNQLEDKSHLTKTVEYTQHTDDKYGRRVVDSDMGSHGCGNFKFISHNRLHHDAGQNCQYLQDDCLYFRIKADPVRPWLTYTT